MDAFELYEAERDEFIRVVRRHPNLEYADYDELLKLKILAQARVAAAQRRLDAGDDWYGSAAAQKIRWTEFLKHLDRCATRELVTTR